MGSGPVLAAASTGDEVFGCDGACRRHSEAGDDVHVLIVTDGCGEVTNSLIHAEMRRNLESEWHGAAQIREYRKPACWCESSTAIDYGAKIVRRLAQLVGETKARLVYAQSVHDPDPTRSVVRMIAREAVGRLRVGGVRGRGLTPTQSFPRYHGRVRSQAGRDGVLRLATRHAVTVRADRRAE